MHQTGNWPGFIAVMALGLAAAPALAFRCGTQLIHEGDSRDKVRAQCGEPSDVERRAILRRPVYWHYGRPYYLSSDQIEAPVETWTYNLGPNKLMRRLRFEDGLVKEIETLGYGYHQSRPPQRRSP